MTTLHTLLACAADLPAEYGDGLTSHLPMALHALQRLGATDRRLALFFERYAARFGERREPVPALRRLPDWSACRGDWSAFAGLRGHFAAAIAEEGATAVLAQALPSLWTGVAAAAFHGPIRTAHAVEAGHAGELASALAYWGARWQPVESEPTTRPALDFDAWFERFVRAGAAEPLDAPLISGRIEMASATASFRADAARLAPPADPVGALARHAARLYARSRNFTVLHLVTAARAVRVLAALAPPPTQALWPAVAAALTAAQVRDRGAAPCATVGWPEVTAAAIESDDDHVIKLVHACTEHAAHDAEPAFLDAARRAVN
jgi:hypothetical protein